MIRVVAPADAFALIEKEGYRYLDVRTVEEFAAGHPEGAVNIPIVHAGMVPNHEFLEVAQTVFAVDEKIVLGCRSGVRSMRAAEVLASAGYANVCNMDGGFHGRFDPMGSVVQAGWLSEGLPVSNEVKHGTSYDALRSKRA